MKSIVVIPARMTSTRLPGKPLIDILGKSLVVMIIRYLSLSNKIISHSPHEKNVIRI